MAITLYSGPPGAGKSYALVEQVIVPAVLKGRRVLTNIDGIKPDAVQDYCEARTDDPDKLGHVVLFDGARATEPGFFPTETIPDHQTILKAGDLLVFDEWRLYWPRRGKLPSTDLEPFLRWHRHLVSPDGVACDVVIGTQLPQDINQDFRGLIERSYKFKKLKAVGLAKAYSWDAYEGHLQPKGGRYANGNGTYKPEIFALYKSYSSEKGATELRTDDRETIFGKGMIAAIFAGVGAFAFAAWWVWGFFTGGAEAAGYVPPEPSAAMIGSPATPQETQTRPTSAGRIVGFYQADYGARVVVLDDGGSTRVVMPDGFNFEYGRPVSGVVDGKRYLAEDRIPEQNQPKLPGFGL